MPNTRGPPIRPLNSPRLPAWGGCGGSGPNCPPRTLTELATTANSDIRAWVASNPSCPPQTLTTLAAHSHVYVREAALANPSAVPATAAAAVSAAAAAINPRPTRVAPAPVNRRWPDPHPGPQHSDSNVDDVSETGRNSYLLYIRSGSGARQPPHDPPPCPAHAIRSHPQRNPLCDVIVRAVRFGI